MFSGTVAAVDGRTLCFGERDEATRKYDHEFFVPTTAKVVTGARGDLKESLFSEVKTGSPVRLSGVNLSDAQLSLHGDDVEQKVSQVWILGEPTKPSKAAPKRAAAKGK